MGMSLISMNIIEKLNNAIVYKRAGSITRLFVAD